MDGELDGGKKMPGVYGDMNVRQIVATLRIGQPRVMQLLKDGVFKAVPNVGRETLIDGDSIQSWLDTKPKIQPHARKNEKAKKRPRDQAPSGLRADSRLDGPTISMNYLNRIYGIPYPHALMLLEQGELAGYRDDSGAQPRFHIFQNSADDYLEKNGLKKRTGVNYYKTDKGRNQGTNQLNQQAADNANRGLALRQSRELAPEDDDAEEARPMRSLTPRPVNAVNLYQPIDTAPKDGSMLDLWAKTFDPRTDQIVWRRYPDCWWQAESFNQRAGWANFDNEHCMPTHWSPIIQGPMPP